jgi:hypothetical protein
MLQGRTFVLKAMWPAFLCVFSVAVMSPTLTAYFHADDGSIVYQLSQIRNPLAIFFDRNLSLQLNYAHFRPFPFLALWVEHALSGVNPLGYHLIPAMAVAFTAFLLGVALSGSGLPLAAGRLAAILFIVSPATVGTAIWPSAQFDVWAALFIVLAFVLLVRARNSDRVGLYGASLGATLLALLSKESVITVAALLPLVDIARFKRLPRLRQIVECSAWWGILATYLLWRVMMLGRMGGYRGADLNGGSFYLQAMMSLEFYWRLMSNIVSPGNLVLVLVFAVTYAFFLLHTPARAAWYGAITVVCALPAVPLLPWGPLQLRYLYLPGIALIAWFAEATVTVWKSTHLVLRAIGVLALAYSLVMFGKASADVMRVYRIETDQEEVATRSASKLLRESDQDATLILVFRDAFYLDAMLRLSGVAPSLSFRVIEPHPFLASYRLAQQLRDGAAMKVLVFQDGQTQDWRDETARAADRIEAHLALHRLPPPNFSCFVSSDSYLIDLRIDAASPWRSLTLYYGPWEAGFWQSETPVTPRYKGGAPPGVWFVGAGYTDPAGLESTIATAGEPIRIGRDDQNLLRRY